MRSDFQVELDFSRHLVLVALGQQGGDETQTGCGIGEDRDNASMALTTLGAGRASGTATAKQPIIGCVFLDEGMMHNLGFAGPKMTRFDK